MFFMLCREDQGVLFMPPPLSWLQGSNELFAAYKYKTLPAV